MVDKLVERQSGLGVVSASAGRQVSGKGVQWNRRQAPRQRATAFLPLFAEDPGWLDALRGAQIEDGLPRPGPSKKVCAGEGAWGRGLVRYLMCILEEGNAVCHIRDVPVFENLSS